MTDELYRMGRIDGPGADLTHREITKRFFQYSSFFWIGPTRRIAWSFTLILLVIILSLVGTAVGINRWLGNFFNALENKNSQLIFSQLWGILLLGMASAVLYGLWTFLGDRMKVAWREFMTDRLINKWLESDHQKHHSQRLAEEIDSPEFRIAEDVRMSIDPVVDLATTFLNALGSAFVFVALLWKIGGSITLFKGIILPGYMMWLAIVYAIVCSVIIRSIGDPIVRLTERKNASEAKLRGDMVRYGELPVLTSENFGNLKHRRIIKTDMDVLFSRWRRLAIYSGQVGALTQFNIVFMPIVPLLAVAPKYFDGDITLGAVVQVSTAFVSVQLALNWYFDHFYIIVNWLSNAQRVVTLIEALEDHGLEGELK